MSTAISTAELIRLRLLTPPGAGELPVSVNLQSIDVIVDTQKDIRAMIARAVGNATGCAIVITWQGFRIPDGNASRPRMEHRYSIAVYSVPIIDGGQRPADHVIESIVARLWHWVPDGGHAHGECQVQNGDMVPDSSYLVYDLEVTVPVIF